MSAEKRKTEEDEEPRDAKKTRPPVSEPKHAFSNCPHELLLLIFKRLNVADLCHIARVCKGWKKAAYDEFLWHNLDLGDDGITLKNMWKLVRHPCFGHAQSIRLSGFLHNLRLRSHPTLSSSLIEKIKETCPRLTSLSLLFTDVGSIACSDLPPGLSQLRLVYCEIPKSWFTSIPFTNLTGLYLDESPRVDFTHIRDLSTASNSLTTISLNGCYRIDDRAMEAIYDPVGFNSLLEIYLDQTAITRYGFELVAKKYGSKLKFVSVGRCGSLSKIDIAGLLVSYFLGNSDYNIKIN